MPGTAWIGAHELLYTRSAAYHALWESFFPLRERTFCQPRVPREAVAANLRAKFGQLFDELGIAGTRAVVERHVTPVPLARPLPASLGGADRETVSVGASFFEGDDSGE